MSPGCGPRSAPRRYRCERPALRWPQAGVAKWHTRQVQVLLVATPWGFDSPARTRLALDRPRARPCSLPRASHLASAASRPAAVLYASQVLLASRVPCFVYLFDSVDLRWRFSASRRIRYPQGVPDPPGSSYIPKIFFTGLASWCAHAPQHAWASPREQDSRARQQDSRTREQERLAEPCSRTLSGGSSADFSPPEPRELPEPPETERMPLAPQAPAPDPAASPASLAARILRKPCARTRALTKAGLASAASRQRSFAMQLPHHVSVIQTPRLSLQMGGTNSAN